MIQNSDINRFKSDSTEVQITTEKEFLLGKQGIADVGFYKSFEYIINCLRSLISVMLQDYTYLKCNLFVIVFIPLVFLILFIFSILYPVKLCIKKLLNKIVIIYRRIIN